MLGYLIGIPTGRADWKICGGCWTLEQAFVCPYDVHFESSSTAATATQCIKITKKLSHLNFKKIFCFLLNISEIVSVETLLNTLVSSETIWIFKNTVFFSVILYSEHLGKSAFSISSALGIQDSARWVLIGCIHQVFVS